jgi:glycosyltransferase involved in cell wall biosynthesis
VFANDLNLWLEGHGHQVFTHYLYHYLEPDALRPATLYTSAMAPYRSRWEKLPGANPRLLWFLVNTLSLFKPDVVQVNGGRALKYGALAKKLTRAGFALVYRSIGSPQFWEKGRIGRAIAKYATAQADAIVAVSDATLAEFGPSTGGQLRRRVHRGSDLAALRGATPLERKALSTPDEARVLIYVGSLSFEKCPLRAVDVFSRLAADEPDLYLWMLGDGPQEVECRQMAADRGVADRLRLTGTVQNVAPYLKAADLHLLTSDTEGLPGCLVESAALGLPCVAADVGGVREIALHGETGFVVEPAGLDDYVAKARLLLENEELRREFGRRASDWAENFSIEAIGPQYMDLYEELLTARKTERG